MRLIAKNFPWPAAALLLLAACQPGVLDPKGPVGTAERSILIDSVGIMLAIVIPTILGTLGVAWWFRESNPKARYRPDWVFSGEIELIVWAIPVLVILLLGGVAWIGSHTLDPAKPLASSSPPLEVQVVSLDWKWLFIYPEEHVATVNQLVIPAGVPVHFSLTSASVLNSFFIPQLGSMIYTMNGMTTQLNLEAAGPGTFRGLSSHFSGDGFAGMAFEVRALPPAGFASWVDAAKGAGGVLDRAGYVDLVRPTSDVPPSTFRDVEPGLFAAIIDRDTPIAPGRP